MSKVMVLPEHIASQIAAGEVIERPASVVKELVENSIDAGADNIEINIESGCLNIRVADNGCGMDADDALLAFHRHATSKLSSADDLWSLTTMGFRGEALPSIASVSHLTCYTRTPACETGVKIECNNGTVSSTRSGCAPGTVIEVADLFQNVPARLQFLKKENTEFANIQEMVQALSLAFPNISFHLLQSGASVLKTSGSGSLADAIVESRFLRSADNLREIDFVDSTRSIRIHGFVGHPTVFRGDRKSILTVVNNRPVRCFVTQRALDYAFNDLIPRGRFPIAVLRITVNPSQVDVNVHPTKREIRYRYGNDVYAAMQHALTKVVRGAAWSERTASFSPTPASAAETQLSFSSKLSSYTLDALESLPLADPSSSIRSTDPLYASYDTTTQVAEPALDFASVSTTAPISAPETEPTAFAAFPAQWRFIGCLHNSYFLVESPAGLEIIEQHIAHERVIYERLLAVSDGRQPATPQSQRLITSVPLQLSPSQMQVLKENIELFEKLGFDFEITRENNQELVRCTEIPLEFAECDYAPVLQRMLEELNATGAQEAQLEIIKSIACQSAVKNGMRLSEQQILKLISQWYATARNDTCPHGRPIKISLSKQQLFAKFHPA